jgi:hypothetical protein
LLKRTGNTEETAVLTELKGEEDDEAAGAKKPLTERAGDWVCQHCRNLNFSFRKLCNRCSLGRQQVVCKLNEFGQFPPGGLLMFPGNQ